VFVSLNVRHLDEVLTWVLGWGSHARVLEPEALHQMVIEKAVKILAQQRESLLT
jgi:predicted DNA-binding transcriptional regulator YafY